MKFAKVSPQEAAELPGLIWHPKNDKFVLSTSRVMWKLERDDDTLLGLLGLYFYTAMTAIPCLWFIPTAELRAMDYRGMRKLMPILLNLHDNYVAFVDTEHAAAVRLVEHLGFVQNSSIEGMYQCN